MASFTPGTPGAVDPQAEADGYLLDLIQEINHVWPNARIQVIGHSEGGFVAEQLFEHQPLSALRNVTRIFSLDSPINGVTLHPTTGSTTSAGQSVQLAIELPQPGFEIPRPSLSRMSSESVSARRYLLRISLNSGRNAKRSFTSGGRYPPRSWLLLPSAQSKEAPAPKIIVRVSLGTFEALVQE